jgi:hypothetical protein
MIKKQGVRPISRGVLCALGATLLALSSCDRTSSQPGVTHVWAIDDGEKVRRDDIDHWGSSDLTRNRVWDGGTIRLFGARNEVVAVQLILEAEGSGASSVDVALDRLSSGSEVIENSGSGGLFDYVGRRIELFTEHYIHVTERSRWAGAWGWSGARPLPDEEHTGWIPDALIPFDAPVGPNDHGVGGAPFSIGGGTLQGVWVDIYIPKDVSAGEYLGTIEVKEQGLVTYTVPVVLEVYGFTLPDTTHFHNFFHLHPALIERHGVTNNTLGYWEMFRKYMHMAHRHRMDLTDGRRPLSVFVQQMKDYYTGAAYSEAYGYEGPGVGVGNGTYSIGTYDQPVYGVVSGFDPATAGDWQAAADAWENWFRANAPDVERFKYMTDEPEPEEYPTIQERASWIHAGQGPGKDLKVFATVKIDPALYGYVDFWSVTVQTGYDPGDGVTAGYDLVKVGKRKRFGELVGIYNGTRPSYGQASALDAFATENRVNPWIGWKYGVDQYFMWEVGYYAGSTYNVWDNQYLERGGGKYWGDGDYLYAGEDGVYSGDSRGVRGPIASIRMKNWRRGQQDYEYLWLAREWGIPTTAIVDGVVPAAFNDYSGSAYTEQDQQPVWSTRGYQFEDARRTLAELLSRR